MELPLNETDILSLRHAVDEVLEPDEAKEAQELISKAVQLVVDGCFHDGDMLLNQVGQRVNFKANNLSE